jgi:hypothetical protein
MEGGLALTVLYDVKKLPESLFVCDFPNHAASNPLPGTARRMK